jgi:hypothetical protein
MKPFDAFCGLASVVINKFCSHLLAMLPWEASAKSLAQDVFITDLSEKFAELRRQIQEDTQRLLQPMCHDRRRFQCLRC